MRKEYKVCVIFVLIGIAMGVFLSLAITKLTPSTYLDLAIIFLSPLTGIIIALSIGVHCQNWGEQYEIIKLTTED